VQRRRARATAPSPADEPKPVTLVTAVAGSLPRTVAATGTLAAEDQVVLNTKVAGRLAELPVDLGSVVRQGDVVAVLDLADFRCASSRRRRPSRRRARGSACRSTGSDDQVALEKTAVVRQARALLTQATAQRSRTASLNRDGILSKAELDQAEADFRVAEARYQEQLEEARSRRALVAERQAALRLAEQALGDATLACAVRRRSARAAPLDRRVSRCRRGRRDIVKMDPLRLRLAVPERESGSVRVGQTVRLRADAGAVQAEGKVVRLSPAVDEKTRTLLIEAEIPNKEGALRPGAFASADVVIDPESPAVLVPADALVTFAGIAKVLGVTDGRIVEKRVRVGRRSGDRLEVLEGVTAGDAVVAEPGNLTTGQPVVVR
jgi:multidrug efflux pump subunit AcrA (membrane-fusion protein)